MEAGNPEEDGDRVRVVQRLRAGKGHVDSASSMTV